MARAGELAFDASSPAVRAAVAEGLATLVDNSLAQPLLKVVLPQVKDLLFDSSTKVRTALADLLLSLRWGCCAAGGKGGGMLGRDVQLGYLRTAAIDAQGKSPGSARGK